MGAESAATVSGPARKRDSWSLKTIVEDVAGKPIGEFQDPSQPLHPYLQGKLGSDASTTGVPHHTQPLTAAELEYADDPVGRVYPPLTGATGRQLHGPLAEHHPAILRELSTPPEPVGPGIRPHSPGPSRRPERVYLHYLLLHIDRLSDTALRYLHHAVEEETAHRQSALNRSPPVGP